MQDIADNEHADAAALADLATWMEKLVGVLEPRQLKDCNDRLQSLSCVNRCAIRLNTIV